jgi:hypothetical protein
MSVYQRWVNGICVVYARRTTQLPAAPVPWDRDVVEADRTAIVRYAGVIRDMFHTSLDELKKLPAAPTALTRDLTHAEIEGVDTALEEGYETIPEDIATMTFGGLEDAYFWVMFSVHDWEPSKPTLRALLTEDPLLARAHAEAPNC